MTPNRGGILPIYALAKCLHAYAGRISCGRACQSTGMRRPTDTEGMKESQGSEFSATSARCLFMCFLGYEEEDCREGKTSWRRLLNT